MKLKPQGTKLLCVFRDLPRDSKVIIPDGATKASPYCEVLDIGPDCHKFVIGDKVLFTPDAAIGVKHAGQEYMFVDEGSVFGTFVEDSLLGVFEDSIASN